MTFNFLTLSTFVRAEKEYKGRERGTKPKNKSLLLSKSLPTEAHKRPQAKSHLPKSFHLTKHTCEKKLLRVSIDLNIDNVREQKVTSLQSQARVEPLHKSYMASTYLTQISQTNLPNSPASRPSSPSALSRDNLLER